MTVNYVIGFRGSNPILALENNTKLSHLRYD